MSTSHYNPKNWDLVFAGYLIEGFGTNTFISITKDAETFTDVVGVDGRVVRGHMHDERATMEITLMQTSPSNRILSDLHAASRAAPNGEDVAALRLVNRTGTDEHKAAEAWILDPPDLSLESGPTERVWKIRMAQYKATHGGQ